MDPSQAAADELCDDAAAPSRPALPAPGTLPDGVRTRVVALAAEALGRLAPEHLPAPLKRVASFAPARRARLAGGQILAVLEADATFRERLAVQVRAATGDLGEAVAEGRTPDHADAVEVAAAAYLLGSSLWEDAVEAVRSRADHQLSASRQAAEQLDRLRRQVAELQEEANEARRRNKDQVDRLKAENAELRRKLGDTKARMRDAERAAEEAGAAAAERTRTAEHAITGAEAEVRRCRGRIAELEAELASARRTEKASRVQETVRARLLLDTLVHAAQGLQRELALPAPDRLPADTVAALEAQTGRRTSTGRASLSVDDPALVEEVLRLPRAHLIVDGYNVTKNSWPDLSLQRQRDRLLTGVAALLARTGAEITVVFDAAETQNRPLVAPPRGVRVLFSPFGVIADDVIRDLVAAEPRGRAVVVASSDQAVARDVTTAGFRVVSSPALAALLAGGRQG